MIKFSREWAMPNSNTFDVPCIEAFVRDYIPCDGIVVDPFARNTRIATYTNDLNPNTEAQYHMEALEFLAMLASQNVSADVVIFDPPYSSRQVAECYSSIGRVTTQQDTQGRSWSMWKAAVARIVRPNGIVLSFGWNSVGMGIKHGFDIERIMLVCHGGVHNDTICMAERRVREQTELSL